MKIFIFSGLTLLSSSFAQDKASVSELDSRMNENGITRWYQKESDSSFTGIVYYKYANGQLRGIDQFQEGLK